MLKTEACFSVILWYGLLSAAVRGGPGMRKGTWMPQEDFRTRLGREGLKSLMRDPRYLDGTHPEHKRVVAAVTRAFELVFDEAPARRAGSAESDPGPFVRTLEMRGVDEARVSRLPGTQRARLGRTFLLDTLEADGVDTCRKASGTRSRAGTARSHGSAPPPGCSGKNASTRPQAERPTTRRPVRTLLSGDEGRDDLTRDSGADRMSDRQLAQVAREHPDRDPTERARPKERPSPPPRSPRELVAHVRAAMVAALRDDVDPQVLRDSLAPALLNNPGGIRHSPAPWDGKSDVQVDPQFVTFDSPRLGIRAWGSTCAPTETTMASRPSSASSLGGRRPPRTEPRRISATSCGAQGFVETRRSTSRIRRPCASWSTR